MSRYHLEQSLEHVRDELPVYCDYMSYINIDSYHELFSCFYNDNTGEDFLFKSRNYIHSAVLPSKMRQYEYVMLPLICQDYLEKEMRTLLNITLINYRGFMDHLRMVWIKYTKLCTTVIYKIQPRNNICFGIWSDVMTSPYFEQIFCSFVRQERFVKNSTVAWYSYKPLFPLVINPDTVFNQLVQTIISDLQLDQLIFEFPDFCFRVYNEIRYLEKIFAKELVERAKIHIFNKYRGKMDIHLSVLTTNKSTPATFIRHLYTIFNDTSVPSVCGLFRVLMENEMNQLKTYHCPQQVVTRLAAILNKFSLHVWKALCNKIFLEHVQFFKHKILESLQLTLLSPDVQKRGLFLKRCMHLLKLANFDVDDFIKKHTLEVFMHDLCHAEKLVPMLTDMCKKNRIVHLTRTQELLKTFDIGASIELRNRTHVSDAVISVSILSYYGDVLNKNTSLLLANSTPINIKKSMTNIQRLYMKDSRKQLIWADKYGHVTLAPTYLKEQCTITTNMSIACILFQFECNDMQTPLQLHSSTGIPIAVLAFYLSVLTKLCVLSLFQDEYCLNYNFEVIQASARIAALRKINNIHHKNTTVPSFSGTARLSNALGIGGSTPEKQPAKRNVKSQTTSIADLQILRNHMYVEERPVLLSQQSNKYILQAAVVRIMKQLKTASFTQISDHLRLSGLDFMVSDLENTITRLIDGYYIKKTYDLYSYIP